MLCYEYAMLCRAAVCCVVRCSELRFCFAQQHGQTIMCKQASKHYLVVKRSRLVSAGPEAENVSENGPRPRGADPQSMCAIFTVILIHTTSDPRNQDTCSTALRSTV